MYTGKSLDTKGTRDKKRQSVNKLNKRICYLFTLYEFYSFKTLVLLKLTCKQVVIFLPSKVYSFRVDESDLNEVLSKFNGKDRSVFIKSALKFYVDFCLGENKNDPFKEINEKLNRIEAAILGLNLEVPLKKTETQAQTVDESKDTTDQFLLESLQDILSL
jgi:hypothetical protein